MDIEQNDPEPHVLVVEDDTGTRALLTRFLAENGFRATGARNGREMWEALDAVAVDLVLLDVMLVGSPASTCARCCGAGARSRSSW